MNHGLTTQQQERFGSSHRLFIQWAIRQEKTPTLIWRVEHESFLLECWSIGFKEIIAQIWSVDECVSLFEHSKNLNSGNYKKIEL